jgi:4'-phosphopantetheinyl transferase
MSQGGHSAASRADSIDVWTAELVDHDDAAAEFACLLDETERERAHRFRFAHQRRFFIQSHGIVRQILADYRGIDPAALAFREGPWGKPVLAVPKWDEPLQFSLSHSGNCCMVAVRRSGPVGIDLEQVRDLPNSADIADRMFTRAEGAFIGRLVGAARRDAFFALWTAKEAVVKALGRSLADYLDRLQFDLDPAGRVRFLSLDGDSASTHAWSVQHVDAPAGFAAALAGCPRFATVRPFTWQAAHARHSLNGTLHPSPRRQSPDRGFDGKRREFRPTRSVCMIESGLSLW